MFVATAFALMLATPARLPALSAEAEMAMTAWTICQHQGQVVLAPGPGTAESISEAVMQRCEMDQFAFLAAWRKQRGAKAVIEVTNLRENYRMAGVVKVLRLRAGPDLADPISIWTSCVGAHSIERSASELAETTADRALDSCLTQEDAVVEEAERKLGSSNGPGVRARFRADARKGIIALITDCRVRPDPARGECLQGTTTRR